LNEFKTTGSGTMYFEHTSTGQALLLALGTLVGAGLGYRVSSAGWLAPLAGLPWLGYTATQCFC
jgi:hypothetical protein